MGSRSVPGLLTVALLGVAACGDSVGPAGSSAISAEDRGEILSVLAESGLFGDGLGSEGATSGAVSAAGAVAAGYAAAEEVTAPRVWGRRRGLPVRRQITIAFDRERGTATVRKAAAFEGRFLLDLTDDGHVNPTEKPLDETLFQRAVLERLDREVVDERGHRHRWRLVAVSPAEFTMTEEATRTVSITRLTVAANGETVADISDPRAPIAVARGVPTFRRGDEVTVTASVTNDDQRHTPPTFVFLHVVHAGPSASLWMRLPMEEVPERPGVYRRSWTVRQVGRERLVVDAIAAQTFVTQSADDYRANVWGVPYVVLDEPAS